MSNVAISVEGLGKKYRIGSGPAEPYGSLRDSLMRGIKAPLRRLRQGGQGSATREHWALKDVSFEVKHGEAVGIIGRNGAGKSTLLKVLSRITEPTTGQAVVHGRVGSLLEVGTGFHPELTGRENIYLNGAVMGMSRADIKRHFDEIVDFAGVEKYLDTPVKRYSSGMYMRLAFAVAAHLEPEVLVVDEVLAVGDAEFQKKCLGKMGHVAREGRAVLFVSHNMQAVSQLTKRSLVLADGQRQFDGPTRAAIDSYHTIEVNGNRAPALYESPFPELRNGIVRARVETSRSEGIHRWGLPISFEFALKIVDLQESLCFSFQVVNELQQPICHFWLFDQQSEFANRIGNFRLECRVPKFRLAMGKYSLSTYLTDRRSHTTLEKLTDICPFEVSMAGIHRDEYEWRTGDCAYLEDAVWSPVEHEDGDRRNERD